MTTGSAPPRLAQWLARHAAGVDSSDHVLGDLAEEHAARAASEGPRAANAWYRRQVLRSVFPLLRARWIARRVTLVPLARANHMDTLRRDVTYGLRFFVRRPAFALVAVLTLALGIGTATAIFTMVDGVLLRPLPFGDGERIVTVWQTDTAWRRQPTQRDRWDRLWFTYPEYQQWSTQQRSLGATALYGSQEMTLGGGDEPLQTAVSTATPSLMGVLGTHVAFGRWFLPDEVGTGTERLAVITHELWTARFGGDSTLVGRSITLDDQSYRVIGVLPPGFLLPSLTNAKRASAAIWIPLGSDGGGQGWDSSYEAIGRLRSGVPIEAATAEIDRLARAASGVGPQRGARVIPRLEAETGSVRRPLALLTWGAVLLLVMACVNVALLLLGEAPSREGELATRRAVGASTSRLVSQLLTESVVLAVLGGAAGGTVAFGVVHLLVAAAPIGFPRIGEVALDTRALGFCAAAVLGTALAFGLAPAVSATRASASDALRAQRGQLGRRQRRVQDFAIALQASLAVLLLVGATMLTRSLQNLNAVDIGLREHDVLTLSITAPVSRYPSPPTLRAFYDALEERLAALPGVRAVGATSNLPFSGRNQTTSIEVDRPVSGVDPKPNVQRRVVRPGFFATMGIPLVAGRLFEPAESATGDAMIVDEAFARQLWPGEPALGKRVKAFGGWFTVVGVVGSVHHTRLDVPPRPTFYLPYSRMPARQMTVVLRVTGDPLDYVAGVREGLRSVDASVAVAALATMASQVARSLSNETYRTILLDLFGGAALLLTGVGVFGVMVRAVNHRRREIGIRMALGALPRALAGEVVRRQIVPVLVGIAAGLAAALSFAPSLEGFTFGITPRDPVTLAVAAFALVVASLCAAAPSVRAATRIDAAAVIRDE